MYNHAMEYDSAIKEEQMTNTYSNSDEFQRHSAERKEPDTME